MQGRLITRITQDQDRLFEQALELLPEELLIGESLDRVWGLLERAMLQVMTSPALADDCRGTTPRLSKLSALSQKGGQGTWLSTTQAARRLGSLCHMHGSQLMERRYSGSVGRLQYALEEMLPREPYLTAAGALRSGFLRGISRVAEDATRLLAARQEAYYPLLIAEAEEYLVRLLGEQALSRYRSLQATSDQLLTAYTSLLQLTLEAEAGGFPKGPYALEVSVAPRSADVQPGRIDQIALVEVAGKPPTQRQLRQFAELSCAKKARRSAGELIAMCYQSLRDPVLKVYDLKFEIGDGSDRAMGRITQRNYDHCVRKHNQQVGVYLDATHLEEGTIVYATPSLASSVRQVSVIPGNLEENLKRVDWDSVVVARAVRRVRRKAVAGTHAKDLQLALFT